MSRAIATQTERPCLPWRRLYIRVLLGPGLVLLAQAACVASVLAAGIPCSPCHDQIQPVWQGSPHELAGRGVKGGFRCQECHAGGLLHPQGVTAANAPDRCGRCHWDKPHARSKTAPFRPGVILKQSEWDKSWHAQAKVSCTACHSVHRYAEGADRTLLRQAGDALCRFCHPRPNHQLAGPGAIAKQPCVGCHNPHGDEAALLDARSGGGKRDLRGRVTHRPVAERKCNDCHAAHLVNFGSVPPDEDELDEDAAEAPVPGKPAFKGLLLAPGRTFCYLCHGKLKANFEASGHAGIVRFKQGEEQSPCLGCHLPHVSQYRRLLRYDGNRLCLACHPGYAPHHFLARGGVKQSELECVKCHLPHGSGNRLLLIQTDICKLCHNM